jgi:dephospho-CoA kinase
VPTLGITGGIATGKTSFVKLLAERMRATVFDADASAGDLLDNDATVRQQVGMAFGEQAFMVNGGANRAYLRECIFSSPEKRRDLEQILHPRIRQRWMGLAAEARKPNEWLIVEIPLLYETGAEKHLGRVAVVACRSATQRLRLSNNRKLDLDTAEKIIASQMDIDVKISKAEHVVWNEGPQNALAGQASLLANYLMG